MKLPVLLFLLLIYSFAFAQPKEKLPDMADTAKVNDLLNESKQYFTSDAEKAMSLSEQARDLANSLGFSTGEGYAYKNIGITYYFQSKYVDALDNYNKSLDIFLRINDNVGISNLYNNIGAVYYDRADYTRALEYYLNALKYAELTGDKLRILSVLNNIGGVYSIKPATKEKALSYYLRALQLSEELKKDMEMAAISANIGAIYFDRLDDNKAKEYFTRSLNYYGDSEGSLNALNALGKLYTRQGKFEEAIVNHNKALALAEKIDNKLAIVQSLTGIGSAYMKQGKYTEALSWYQKAVIPAKEGEPNDDTKDLYKQLAVAYEKSGDLKNALQYQELYSSIKDTIYNIETDKKLGSLQFEFDMQKKEGEIKLLTKDKELAELSVTREKLARNAFAGGLLLVFLIAALIFRNYRAKVKTNKILDAQNHQIEDLLHNILPVQVAEELKISGTATPRDYECVSVLFTDFKGFTRLTESMDPSDLVAELNSCFIAFDAIIGKYELEKIKTIGDSYMCAGGIPTPKDGHVHNMVQAGLEILDFISSYNQHRISEGKEPWELRIGIHVGPVVAGVVGKKKYAYDIWGSTVNIASRMESNGLPGKVNISESTYRIISDKFNCSYRGKIHAKNVGEIDMYLVEPDVMIPLPVAVSASQSNENGIAV